jgi:hypothetical protein
MMKVVINQCFGGFGLSDQAVDALIGKCEHIQLIDPVEYYGGPGSRYYEVNKERLTPDSWRESYERDLNGDGLRLTRFHDGKVISDRHDDDISRACPALVKVVEDLGDVANGQFAQLSIVEIPDGIEYEISDYDGSEHVAERHRTWR